MCSKLGDLYTDDLNMKMLTTLKLLVAVLIFECMMITSSECKLWEKKSHTSTCRHDADVLIIGAGMAGISATHLSVYSAELSCSVSECGKVK